MQKFNIEIFDAAGENTVAIVKNVPAETEIEACQKVVEKRGFIQVGLLRNTFYAIDPEYLDDEDDDDWSFKTAVKEMSERLLDGSDDEALGLMQLFGNDDQSIEEEWED